MSFLVFLLNCFMVSFTTAVLGSLLESVFKRQVRSIPGRYGRAVVNALLFAVPAGLVWASIVRNSAGRLEGGILFIGVVFVLEYSNFRRKEDGQTATPKKTE